MKLLKMTVSCIGLLIFTITVRADSSCALADCSGEVGISVAEMLAYPTPNVRPLTPNDALLYDRTYRRVGKDVQIRETPNGNVASTLGAGFNYVTVLRSENGWSEISPDHWVPSDVLSEDVLLSRFAGVRLPEEPLPYPMAWLLKHVRPSASPGEDAAPDAMLLYRYTRVSLFNAVDADGYLWYQIGPGQWVHQFNVAQIIPVDRPADVDTERWISVDLYEQVVIAYENDKPVFATLVSSGLPEWSTNEGLFHIYIRYPRTLMSGANGQPDFYYLEEVPWTMYFDDDIALHGTYWHDGFGYRQSHGCVNLSITDANWLYSWTAEEFDYSVDNDLGPAVFVYSSGDYK